MIKFKKIKKYYKYTILVSAAIVVAFMVGRVGHINVSEAMLTRFASAIVQKCNDATYKPVCYEDEIVKIAGFLTMEDSFRLTKVVQEQDPGFAYCHVLAHKLSFLESKRNPDDWKGVMARCPIAMCNYGCLHGSLIEHFRGEVLDDLQIEEAIDDIKDVCEPRPGFDPTEIDRTMCYHALGHLAMYMTGGNPEKSLGICKSVSYKSDGRDYYETCVEGIFMTVFQGVDPEDIALVAHIKPEKDKVSDFCSDYVGVDFEACNRESYPLFRDELGDPAFIQRFCSYSKDKHGVWKCYATALGNVTVEILEGQRVEPVDEICKLLPASKFGTCFANIAARMVQVDPDNLNKAVDVCRVAEGYGVGDECYRDIISYAVFTTKENSSGFVNYCSMLPEKWNNKCLEAGL